MELHFYVLPTGSAYSDKLAHDADIVNCSRHIANKYTGLLQKYLHVKTNRLKAFPL